MKKIWLEKEKKTKKDPNRKRENLVVLQFQLISQVIYAIF